MYRESAVLFRRLIAYAAFFVIVEFAIAAVDNRWPMEDLALVISMANWILFMYLAFATNLSLHVEKRTNIVLNFAGFFLRCLGLLVLTLAIPIVVLIFMHGDPAVLEIENQASDDGLDVAYITVLTQIIFVAVFALFGTSLAAQVTRRRQSLGASLRQGRRAFWRTAGLLLAGPFVLELAAFGGDSWAMYLSTGNAFAIDGLDLVSPGWRFNVPVAVLVAVSDAIYAFATVMTAWVLSKTFLETVEGADVVAVFE